MAECLERTGEGNTNKGQRNNWEQVLQNSAQVLPGKELNGMGLIVELEIKLKHN